MDSSKPPFDMTTTRFPSFASRATTATMSSTFGCSGRPCRGLQVRDQLLGWTGADLPAGSSGRFAGSRSDRPPRTLRAKSSWNTSGTSAERGSKIAQMRRPGYAERTPASVSKIAVDDARNRRRRRRRGRCREAASGGALLEGAQSGGHLSGLSRPRRDRDRREGVPDVEGAEQRHLERSRGLPFRRRLKEVEPAATAVARLPVGAVGQPEGLDPAMRFSPSARASLSSLHEQAGRAAGSG